MAIYYVEREYKIEPVYLTVRCFECGLNNNITAYSNQSKIIRDCKRCEQRFEIKIVVCPECNSSAHTVILVGGAYYCRTCEKLVMNDHI